MGEAGGGWVNVTLAPPLAGAASLRAPNSSRRSDPARAVFCVKKRRANGGVSGNNQGSPARRLQTVHAIFCSLGRSTCRPVTRPVLRIAALGKKDQRYVPGGNTQTASVSQDLVEAEPL